MNPHLIGNDAARGDISTLFPSYLRKQESIVVLLFLASAQSSWFHLFY